MGERLMSSQNGNKLNWPYMFCKGCKKLAPVKKDEERPELEVCMVCDRVCNERGRVMFTPDEARVRKLAVLRIKPKEK